MSDETHQFHKIVDGWGETSHGPNMTWIDTSSRFALEKIARAAGISAKYIPGSLQQKIAEIQGKLPPTKVAFYNRALGGFESYGLNNNGDGWFRTELMRKHATFVDHARYFRNHKNKAGQDPDFGRPIASAFNDKTDMVDLIIVGDLDKQAEEDIQMLERGISLPTSMGCKVAFDVCIKCGNKAKHRGEYCEHVKEGAAYPFGLGRMLPDGTLCGVMNPDPCFFDISRLPGGNPAFRGSENLLKVAADKGNAPIVVSSAARAEQAKATKPAVAEKPTAKCAEDGDKLADMIKELPARIDAAILPSGEIVGAMAASPVCSPAQMPADKIKDMAKKAGVDAVVATSAALGIVLGPDEFSALMDQPVSAPTVAQILAHEPSKTACDWVTGETSDVVARELASVAEGRSFLQPWLVNTISKTAGLLREAMQPSGKKGLFGEDGIKGIGGALMDRRKAKQVPAAAPAAKIANDMYVQYRAALLATMNRPSLSGERAAMKLAETSARYVTPSSAAFALLAFCQVDEKNALGGSRILAKQSSVTDTHYRALRVSGAMADDFGKDVLETLAGNSLQRPTRS